MLQKSRENRIRGLFAPAGFGLALSLAIQVWAQQPSLTPAKGTWTMLPSMLAPQNEAAVAVIDGRMYVMGGFGPGSKAPITRVQVFDVARNQWSEGTPLPEPLHHHGAVVVGGKIYLVGGFHEPFARRIPIDHTWMFDPANKQWSTRAPLAAPRGALVVGAIGNLIYAAGGEHNRPGGKSVPQGAPPAYEPVADFAVYDTAADHWTALPSMKVARDHAYAGVINNHFYVVGGRDRPKYDISTVEDYDPAARSWSERAPMPTGRSGGHASVLGGQLYVFGGEGNPASPLGIYDEVEAFNPANNSWMRYEPMPSPRHSLVAATVGNRIYLPGGATSRGGGDLTDKMDAFEPGK